MLEAFRARSAHAGVLLDFDGSLSQIVARPELARPVEGAREVLATLVDRIALVAVITGRRAEEVADLLQVDGVTYEGLYGMQDTAPELAFALLPEVELAAALEPTAWAEHKGASIAVHYRQSSDPDRARIRLLAALETVATASGMELVEGKRVIELVPHDRPRKGGAVRRLVGEFGLLAALVAGDDAADLDAFSALDELAATHDVLVVKVAVRSEGTPQVQLDDLARAKRPRG